jgi:Flp pilus assembly protein TadD
MMLRPFSKIKNLKVATGALRLAACSLALTSSVLLLTNCGGAAKKNQSAAGASGEKGELTVDGEGGSTAAASGEPAAEGSGESSAGGAASATSVDGKVDKKYAALAQAVRSGRSGGILEEAAKILSADQHDTVALNSLALYHLRKGRLGAAKLLLNRAFEKNQKSAALYNNLGVVLEEQGDPQGALSNFKKALRVDDHHAQALGNLGSLYVQAGDYSKAQPLLEQAYRLLRSTNTGVATNYAIVLRANKDFEGAKRVYDELLKANSKDVEALLNYSILLIDFMNKPKDGLALVYKVKFLETERTDILDRANALEKKARSGLK